MVDKLDYKIIEVLSEDGRASYAEIGRKIGLSSSSVRERMQRLTDTGVIQKFSIELNHSLLGNHLKAFILIKLFPNNLRKFLSIVNQLEGVQNSHRITGSHNILMKVVLRDHLHLQSFLDQIMIYGDTTTYIILSEIEN
ncbi:MAG: ArsR family transcriptional regulator [Marinilabiliales bacterium]|nr:MAG: ArsR family transcriptional regulator [Marinilabiliales bacterium]